MARIQSTLVKMLMLYLVLLPTFGLRAEAQGAPRPTVDAPRPFDPPGPAGPRPANETVFTASTEPVTLRSFNGFSSEATPGLFTHHGHGHGGGVATIDSPWGERLDIRYWLTPRGVAFEYDGDLVVRYNFDDRGTLEEIVAETASREARMAVGKRAELAYLGQRDFREFDLSAYALIEESLRARHSKAFLDGLGQLDGPAEVSCATQGIQCVVCIIAWAASVGAIAAPSVAGSVPTFGLSCFLAIVAHEATNFTCAATCIEWNEDCFGGAPENDGDIPQGCEP